MDETEELANFIVQSGYQILIQNISYGDNDVRLYYCEIYLDDSDIINPEEDPYSWDAESPSLKEAMLKAFEKAKKERVMQ